MNQDLVPFQIELLERYINRNVLSKYINKLYKHKDTLNIDYGFYGFIEEYYHISKMLDNKKDKIIVDIGCGIGLQSVFFKDFKGYIGIELPDMKKFTLKTFYPNQNIIYSKFKNAIKKEMIKIDCNNMIGIAHMSLLYSPDNADDLFYFDIFKQKIII